MRYHLVVTSCAAASIVALSMAAAGCGGAAEANGQAQPSLPASETGEDSEARVDDGRQHFTLPDDGSLGELEALLIRHRDEGAPVRRIVIHTARSAAADDAQSYLGAIRALVRRLALDPDVRIGGPADTPHLTIVIRHPSPLGP